MEFSLPKISPVKRRTKIIIIIFLKMQTQSVAMPSVRRSCVCVCAKFTLAKQV